MLCIIRIILSFLFLAFHCLHQTKPRGLLNRIKRNEPDETEDAYRKPSDVTRTECTTAGSRAALQWIINIRRRTWSSLCVGRTNECSDTSTPSGAPAELRVYGKSQSVLTNFEGVTELWNFGIRSEFSQLCRFVRPLTLSSESENFSTIIKTYFPVHRYKISKIGRHNFGIQTIVMTQLQYFLFLLFSLFVFGNKSSKKGSNFLKLSHFIGMDMKFKRRIEMSKNFDHFWAKYSVLLSSQYFACFVQYTAVVHWLYNRRN